MFLIIQLCEVCLCPVVSMLYVFTVYWLLHCRRELWDLFMCSDLGLPSHTDWNFWYFQNWCSFIIKQCAKKFNYCKSHLEYSIGVLFLIILITASFMIVQFALFEVDDPSIFYKVHNGGGAKFFLREHLPTSHDPTASFLLVWNPAAVPLWVCGMWDHGI